MKWEVLIVFGVVLASYLVFLAVFSIVKNIIHKKKLQKELKERENEQSKTSNY